MKIEHIAMYVSDLEGTRDFFIRYLDAQCGGLYHNQNTGFRSYFLTFADGARLEIMTRPELRDGERSGACLGYAHIAFSVGSKERVDSLTARLASNGYRVISGPRVTGDGYYESCILGPEQNVIEITV